MPGTRVERQPGVGDGVEQHLLVISGERVVITTDEQRRRGDPRRASCKGRCPASENTGTEPARALWGPHVGPYTPRDARAALDAWDPAAGRQASYGIIERDRLLGALGLMIDGPDSAELAYWVRPESRRQGLALRGINALTRWTHDELGLDRIWLEIDPTNTPSLSLADRAGYQYEQRLPHHCRAWTSPDPDSDTWHDCMIWAHTKLTTSAA